MMHKKEEKEDGIHQIIGERHACQKRQVGQPEQVLYLACVRYLACV